MSNDNIFNNPADNAENTEGKTENAAYHAEETVSPVEVEKAETVAPVETVDTVNAVESVQSEVVVDNAENRNPETSYHGAYYSYSPNGGYKGQGNMNSNPQYYDASNAGGKPPKKKRTGLKIAIAIIAALSIVTVVVISSGIGIIGLVTGITSHKNTSTSSQTKNESTSSYDSLVVNSKPSGADEYTANSDGSLTAAAVIAKVRPSIVGIIQYTNSGIAGLPNVSGQGSGIIISEDGVIITNAHVVEGATMVTVVLDNEQEYKAEIKGIDTQTDLAVLKIDAKGLPAAELGDSAQTVVGESVIAIGNPGGLELAGSCTGGMVSGLDRTISGDSGYAMSYIQTDAAINPGNSGGALVNMYAQVIGINSAKISADGYENLGFAIPINEAIPIVNDLKNYGYVKNRAKIGITFQLITETVSQYYNYSIPSGLLITSIDETCDIAKKNVEVNDIITHIEGNKISSANDVYTALQGKKPGESVKLKVYRMGTRFSSSKTFDVTVMLSEDKGTEE